MWAYRSNSALTDSAALAKVCKGALLGEALPFRTDRVAGHWVDEELGARPLLVTGVDLIAGILAAGAGAKGSLGVAGMLTRHDHREVDGCRKLPVSYRDLGDERRRSGCQDSPAKPC